MNPEVLSLVKMAGLFVFLVIMLLVLRKPLNLVMSISCVIVIALYWMSPEVFLPAIQKGLIGVNTIRSVLVLYFITFLQRMMEKRNQLSGCQMAMNGLFNNRRINASVVPFLLGCLPAASTVILCGPIVREAIGDNLTTNEKAACTSYFRHISEAFLPTYNSIFIAISLTQGKITAGTFVLAMLPVVAILFLSGWMVYLRRVPKDTGMTIDQSKGYYFKQLVASVWPIVVAIAIVLVFKQVPVWAAVVIVVVLNFFISKFSFQEVKPFFKSAFEGKLMLNTLAVMTFSQLLGASGVVELLPKYFGMLPIPMWLVFALLFFVGPLMGGSLTMIAICVPMMVEIWPDSLLSVFILCMSMTYIIMQIAPTHICLTLCAEDYKITLGDLIPKVAPMAVVATVFVFIYFFVLRAIGL